MCPRLNDNVNHSQIIQLLYGLTSGRQRFSVNHSTNPFGTLKTIHQDPKAGARKRNTTRKRRLENNKDIILHNLSATVEAHRATNRGSIIRNVPVDRKVAASGKPLEFQNFKPKTVEAHRATNRGSTVRNVSVEPTIRNIAASGKPLESQNFKPKISYNSPVPVSSNPEKVFRYRQPAATVEHVSVTQEPTVDMKSHISGSWAPALQESKRVPKHWKAYASSTKATDYVGKNLNAVGQWMWSRKRSEGATRSPWMSLMKDHEGDGLARY